MALHRRGDLDCLPGCPDAVGGGRESSPCCGRGGRAGVADGSPDQVAAPQHDRAMSDLRLRELERRWLESRSLEAEARYLLERSRVGDLDDERLKLAAWCGHEGARHATGVSPCEVADGVDVASWVRGLHETHPRLFWVAMHVAYEHALTVWRSEGTKQLHWRQEKLRSALRVLSDASSPTQDQRFDFEFWLTRNLRYSTTTTNALDDALQGVDCRTFRAWVSKWLLA